MSLHFSALLWFLMQYFALSCPAGKKDTRANTLLSRINPLTATSAQVAKTKTLAGRLIISSGLTSLLQPLFQCESIFLMTSERRLHSFGLRFYFGEQSFERPDISCLVSSIGNGILHILFHICQIRVSTVVVTNYFPWHFSCGIFFEYSWAMSILNTESFTTSLLSSSSRKLHCLIFVNILVLFG